MMEVLCWLLLAAIFIIIEIITLGLTTIWFAGGAFVAAVAGLLGANLVIQILLFVIVSVILLMFTRPLAVKHLDTKTEKTNAEALVGQTARVLYKINNLEETGLVKINGMEWTARTSDDAVMIQEGEIVRIVEIQGVKLIVERAAEEKTEKETE